LAGVVHGGLHTSVFDLGGNVAEWTIGPDGVGVVKGGSADRSREETTHGVESSLEYRGVRVVRRR
jgi:hypothetical protein